MLRGIEGGRLRDRRRDALTDANALGGAFYCRVFESWDPVRAHALRERHLLRERVIYELLGGLRRRRRVRSAACGGDACDRYGRQRGAEPVFSTDAIHLISLSRCGVACTRDSVSATCRGADTSPKPATITLGLRCEGWGSGMTRGLPLG